MPNKVFSNIRNIIFDLGAVLLNIDEQKSIDAFAELGFTDFDKQYTLMQQSQLFDRLETGKISPDDFRSEIRTITGRTLSDEQIDTAWNQILMDFPQRRFDLLTELKSNYRLFLLSNTNIIHYWKYTADFKEKFGTDFRHMFEHVYVSHEVGYRKPEPEIYKFVLKHSGLNPRETLFIDDNKDNIMAAEQAGIRGYHLPNGEEVVDLFQKEDAFML